MQSIHAVFQKLSTRQKVTSCTVNRIYSPMASWQQALFHSHWVTPDWTAAVHMILIMVAFETTTRFPTYFIPLKSCLSKLMSKFSECWNLGNTESWGKQPIKSTLPYSPLKSCTAQITWKSLWEYIRSVVIICKRKPMPNKKWLFANTLTVI